MKESGTRLVWMDRVRGAAILLVAVLHSSTLLGYVQIAESPYMIWLNHLFSPYRMPTLVFLSGLLMPGSLKKPLDEYLTGKVRRILWPLLIWATAYAFLVCRLHPSVTDILNSILGASYLWYILFIFIYYCASILFRGISPAWLFIAAITFSFASPDGTKYYERFFYLYAVFCLGWLAAENKDRFLRIVESPWSLIAVPVVVAFSVVAAENDLSYSPKSIVPALAFVVLVARIFRALDGRRGLDWLSFVGRNSLIYYTAHFPVMFVTMYVLSKLGYHAPLLLGVAALALAMAASTALALAADRWSFVNLAFSLPPLLQHRTRRRQDASMG